MHESESEKETINLKHFIEEATKLLSTKVSRADCLVSKDESA
jgi:hypothetical protein